jgi:hypothetical protein
MIRVEGGGPEIHGLQLQGLWDPGPGTTDSFKAGYPISSLLLNDSGAHTNDKRALCGIEIEGNQGETGHFVGPGKLVCPGALTINLCRVGIACIATPNPDHADQLNLARFVAPFCDVGIRLANLQSVMHSIDHFDQINCDTAFRVEAGGKIQCNQLDMQGDYSKIGLHILGIDQGGQAGGHYRFGVINVDGSTVDNNNACRAVFVDPQGGAAVGEINIGFLQLPDGRVPGQGAAAPVIELKNFYGSLNIYAGNGFYNGMIKVTGGNAGYFPKIRIFSGTFFDGHSPRPEDIFSGDSTGYVHYEYDSCIEAVADTQQHNPINRGQAYTPFQGLLNLSLDPPFLSGGYVNQRNIVETVTSNYALPVLAEVVHVDSTAGDINITLPEALNVPSKVYTIKKIVAANNVVVLRSGTTDTIDGATSMTLTGQWSALTVQSTGATWQVLSFSAPFGAAGLAALAAGTASALRDAAGATSGVYPISQIQSRSLIQIVTKDHNPERETDYFFGGTWRTVNDIPWTSDDGYRRFYFPAACRVKAAIIWVSNLGGFTGTGETCSVYIRKNGDSGTDTLISSSVTTNHATGTIGKYLNSSLDMAFAAEDYLNIRIRTPNWQTKPEVIGWNVNLVVQWE